MLKKSPALCIITYIFFEFWILFKMSSWTKATEIQKNFIDVLGRQAIREIATSLDIYVQF